MFFIFENYCVISYLKMIFSLANKNGTCIETTEHTYTCKKRRDRCRSQDIGPEENINEAINVCMGDDRIMGL